MKKILIRFEDDAYKKICLIAGLKQLSITQAVNNIIDEYYIIPELADAKEDYYK